MDFQACVLRFACKYTVRRDLTEATLAGAWISIVAAVLMLMLFFMVSLLPRLCMHVMQHVKAPVFPCTFLSVAQGKSEHHIYMGTLFWVVGASAGEKR